MRKRPSRSFDMIGLLTSILLSLFMVLPAAAVEPDEILKDPKLESRARALSAELRCLVCQNQSIDDSNAPLARDLRVLVRERLTAGDSDNEIIEFVVARYGEFVLLRPRLTLSTVLLWLTPVIVLTLGGWLAWGVLRRPAIAGGEVPALSEEDQARLDTILARKDPEKQSKS